MLSDKLYKKYQPLLFSIAYRMLGTVSDAEDIVQDVYLRAGERDLTNIENIKAYLSKMVTNSCLDYLKSARKNREAYTGPWLPEPLVLNENDPYIEVLKGDLISMSILFLFETLNPIERAVFILREVFEYDYLLISEIVGRNETACRKIFSRVKKKIPMSEEEEQKQLKSNRKEAVIRSFVQAIADGNLQQIENMLSHEITLYSDGGGKVFAALKPLQTKEIVLRFIENLYKQVSRPTQAPPSIQLVNINGEPGLLAVGPDNVRTVISFHVSNQQIKDIYIVRNPDKIKHIL